MRLYIATSNPGKLPDFAAATTPNITLTPLPELKYLPAPAEDEPTFEGNARLKAIYYSHHAPGEIVIADDSGLEVDALNGAPGVRSARYAEDQNFFALPESTPDERNNLCLLEALNEAALNKTAVSETAPSKAALSKILSRNPSARYHCVLAAARDGKILATADGTVEGEILSTPRGTQGFGYDPLFYLPEQNRTMAELDIPTKLTFSHRGRAFKALIKALLQHLQLAPNQ